jgi:type VI secretion system protein
MLLLERIQALERGRPITDDQASLQRSIMHHLTAMLNTRRGSVPIAEDYGIGDIMDVGGFSKADASNLERDLEEVIRKYEPRLAKVHVVFSPRKDLPLSAVFQIEAMLVTDAGLRPMNLETIIEADGTVRLQDASELQEADVTGGPATAPDPMPMDFPADRIS